MAASATPLPLGVVAHVYFVDIPYRLRGVLRGRSLVLRADAADLDRVDVRLWVRSRDWDGVLAGELSARRLRHQGRLVAEGRPSALSTFFDAFETTGTAAP